MCRLSLKTVLAVYLAAAGWATAQDTRALIERAKRAYVDHQYAAAERDFREAVRQEPENVLANLYLGHTLFRMERYAAAVEPYEKVRTLEQRRRTLSQTDTRVLTDQLVMAYGISGQLAKAHALLDVAIQRDPDYPFNYYNRACAFAEEGNKAGMLTALRQAYARKEHVIAGEKLTDPRKDSSFQKYLRDPDFVRLMQELGLR